MNAGPAPVVEVVGRPGTGKSTLLDLVAEQAPESVSVIRSARRMADRAARFRAGQAGGAALARTTVAWGRPPTDLQTARWWLRLGAFGTVIADAPSGGVTVLDQGPVYTLLRLGRRCTTPRATAWWTEQIDDWAARLDAVVVLDAPTLLLLERISRRDKHHALRGAALASGGPELERMRLDIERMVAQLEARAVPVHRVDTGTDDVKDTAAGLATLLAAVVRRSPDDIDPTTRRAP